MSYFETGSTQLIARDGYAGVGGFTDAIKKLGSAIKSGAGSALNFYNQQQQQAGQIQAYQQQAAANAARGGAGGMPGWVLPVAAVGGLGLVAFVLLKRKKRNPSRGRRRWRRR